MTWETLIVIAGIVLVVMAVIAYRSNSRRGDSFVEGVPGKYYQRPEADYERTRREVERQLLP